MHHIVSRRLVDRACCVRELAALYAAFAAGRPSPLPELPVQYADFAALAAGAGSRGEALEAQLAYWRRQLAGAPPALELPTDRPRPAVQTSAARSLAVGAAARRCREAVRGPAPREGATLFMALLAAFEALLARYTGQDDLAGRLARRRPQPAPRSRG